MPFHAVGSLATGASQFAEPVVLHERGVETATLACRYYAICVTARRRHR
jgi:hypothetical protein